MVGVSGKLPEGRTMRRALILLSVISSSALLAAERFPLGAIGATGEVRPGSAAIAIIAVSKGGPGEGAGLQPGDQVLTIDGEKPQPHSNKVDDGGRGPQKTLGEAMARVMEGIEESRILHLEVARGEEMKEIEVSLPQRPSLLGPRRREASRELSAFAAAQLIATQKTNGRWDSPVGLTGDRVLSAWALNALLAHGDSDHAEAIEKAAKWLRGPKGLAWIPDDFSKGPDNLGNWAIAATAMALSEHRLATGDDEDLTVIERCCRALIERLNDKGLFGHDVSTGYSGKGFNVINTQAHLAWAMAAEAGVPIDEASWQLSLEQISRSVSANGGVRYWTMKGTGTGDASLRTGSMALALSVSGREEELAERFSSYLATHAARARESHAVGSLGMMVTAPALWALDREGYEKFIDEWAWYLTLLRGPDDRLRYIGGKRNNGGDSYLGVHRIACIIAIQLLACPEEKLRMHRPPNKTPAK